MRQRQNKQAPSTIEQYNTDIRYVQGSDVVVRKYRVCYSYEMFTNMLPPQYVQVSILGPDTWPVDTGGEKNLTLGNRRLRHTHLYAEIDTGPSLKLL